MRRVVEFDALRAFAAIAVLMFHLQPKDGHWSYFGLTGVHLFLVLSGYLITGIVMRHVGKPGFFRAFYARRIIRIWPVYFLTLGTLWIWQRFQTDPPPTDGLPYYLTFTQRAWEWPGLNRILSEPPKALYAFEHSWTLALEEQFYLVWPVAIAIFGRKALLPLVCSIIGFCLWFKSLGYHPWILPNVIGAFGLGGLIAVMLDDKARVERNRFAYSMIFVASSLVGFIYLRWYFAMDVPEGLRPYMAWRDPLQNFSFYMLHFGFVGFVATNAGAWFLAPLRAKELTFLGEISYGLYLYHIPVFWAMNDYELQTGEPWTMRIAKIAVSFVIATLSYRYVEMPILKLKDRFEYGKKREKKATPQPPTNPAIPRPRLNYAPAPAEPQSVSA